MSFFLFDPEANKVTNSYGGYDPNEKGLFQYPRRPRDKFETSSGTVQSSFEGAYGLEDVAKNQRVLDSVFRHYRLFVQDPDQTKKETDDAAAANDALSLLDEDCESDKGQKPISCNIARLKPDENRFLSHPIRKPIDPVHWKSDLFDTHFEKYYLTNNLIEDPYRPFLTSVAIATRPPHHFTEYKESFSGNPAKTASSSGLISGLSRPTDIPETCDWRRNRTQKLRDVVFTHEKNPINSHLNLNDPKRYNPWPRLRLGYDEMLEGNYRPRPSTSVQYNVTTLLPAVDPYSKQWII